ncbi:hypothetical protein [Iodobacter fluviatilis]|uniref:Uncharacterized protein n=1 Tax=Iodobacter fluviatilis TaxID=537 RepID=A0A377Q3G1_9NEIS|nr:hypothetical protein [Iodobacter fluviatilis]TCU90315.1 hypothetical protein EV682_101341 [Iodobacter fluviatilis]STQ89342.1 Uncharacterised protein [Iodobacter fluviatilis]
MKHFFSALIFAAATFSAHVAASPDITALVTYETRMVSTEGVTKTTRFQETWLRTPRRIWSERLVPQNAQAETRGQENNPKGHEGHSHSINFALAGKLVELGDKGEVKLHFIDRKMRQVIEMGTTDFREMGFDGQWESAAYMLDRQQLKTMDKRGIPAAAGEVWLETRKNGMYTLVLWSEKLQLPRLIETGKEDGGSWSRITVEPQAMPKEMPWPDTAGYRQRDYMDLLD